jgi:hypothetical protein
MFEMRQRWLCGVALLMLIASQAAALADWKSSLARTAVGAVAREGIGDAVENAVKDRAFDAALDAAGSAVSEVAHPPTIGATAGDAIDAAMTAADVASSLNTALDVADAARKVNNVRRVIKRIH